MTIEAPRGTVDVLPADQPRRAAIEQATVSVARRYGYGRITLPTFEDTELFARTSGQGSDLVTKEMYTFADRGGRSLTLRPEATASVARAYVQHGLHRAPQPVKTYLVGPMFRYAAPQKGRYREFWQVNFEAMGSDDPAVDAELVDLYVAIARELGIEGLRLELNTIGDRACRPGFVEELRAFLGRHDSELDDDTRRKAEVSPLRVFDTKNEDVRAVLSEAPTIAEALCEPCRQHFAEVRAFLDGYGVAYEVAPTLVRGLDYYTRTVFEFVNDGLEAAQATVCAGGRYDYLMEEIGGQATPGVGFAAGIERMAMSLADEPGQEGTDVFFVVGAGADRLAVLTQMARLRRAGLSCDADYAGRSVKGQLTQAGRLGAATVVLVEAGKAAIRSRGVERSVPVAGIMEALSP